MKRTYLLMSILIILSLTLIAGCGSNEVTGNISSDMNACSDASCTDASSSRLINIDKLEIYHFHGTNQCSSCTTVGDYAEATVNTYFKDELESGIIVFDHINGDLSENRDLVVKYGATGSSLWLGTYFKDGSFKAEQNINVWYKIKNKEEYMNYLKGVIEQKLAGD